MYPNKIKLTILESQHSDYTRMLPALQEIDLLVSGGYKLKAAIKQFLLPRPGEELAVYEARINKFTYLNILSIAINEQASKLSNATLTINGIEEETNSAFWSAFREDTNLAGRSEKNLIALIFRELLKFKKLYLHVDKPYLNIDIQNKSQEEFLGIRPYVIHYSPFQVVNWSETKGKLDWVKVRQIVEDTSNPLAISQKKVIWTFIDDTYIARYEAFVELDKYGNISTVAGEFVNDDTTIPEMLNSVIKLYILK
ncbi:hypothetical protein AA650_04905 [Anabaena sp. WA102]|uniref:hypothetical protein n=1 Tax=Anabaena sp. WA102 TaxID=1647413 RepID=UPI0006ABFD9D|nr:hypothetical protein [Anabaena sp. WA102]ALB39889.1 hypothetical protein AA650_04905 [Anabaena sp. WA102]